MLIDLLVVENCPHESPARELIAAALADTGRPGVHVATIVVTTDEQTRALRFVGSPTIRINGRDPFGSANDQPSLSCRLYLTEAGLSGIPARAALRDAILREVDSQST